MAAIWRSGGKVFGGRGNCICKASEKEMSLVYLPKQRNSSVEVVPKEKGGSNLRVRQGPDLKSPGGRRI